MNGIIERSWNMMSLRDRKKQCDLNIKNGVKLAEFKGYYVMRFAGYELRYVIKLSDFTVKLFNDDQSAIDYVLDLFNSSGKQLEI